MRKFLSGTFLFCISIFSNSLLAQIAFNDALALKDTVIGNRIIIVGSQGNMQILSQYLAETNPDVATIVRQFSDNPFFTVAGGQMSESEKFDNKGIGIPKGLGGLNVTNIADGIAQFLIKRGKQELDAAFFNQMKKLLNKHEECKILFPATIEFLERIDPYKYSEFLQSLREAFHKDLSNFIIHVNEVIDLPKYDSFLNRSPGIRLTIKCANIVSELSQPGRGITPDTLISQLASLPWTGANNNLGNALNLLNIISQSINETDGNKSWVRLSDLNQMLFNNSIRLKIFIGLLYQQVKTKNISFTTAGSTIRADTFFARNRNTIFRISGLVENFSLLANEVDQTINDFNTREESALTNEDYYTYISKAINIIEYGFKAANIIKQGVSNDKYIVIARNANDLFKNIYTRNYNNAVMNAYTILDSIMPADSANKILPIVLKYGNFMASVIRAESADEVESAIEASALPAGSYSIKQRSAWNLSLNGYIGYARDYNGDGLYADGVYAPVGISFSRGSRTNGFTLSAFASVIDVGGIATYRLANGTADSLKQEVRLGSIFSPSAQLLIEKAKFPLALCVGWRLSPKLVFSKQNGFTIVPAQNVFNAGILIYIPVFSFWNKPFVNK